LKTAPASRNSSERRDRSADGISEPSLVSPVIAAWMTIAAAIEKGEG